MDADAADREAGSVGVAVAAGGAAGALARFAVSGWTTTWAAAPFPWGTFAVNALGSLALGVLTGALLRRDAPPALRGFLLTGLCGGFTTFSTFDYEVLAMLQRGTYGTAAAYALGSVAVCVAGVWVGFRGASGG